MPPAIRFFRLPQSFILPFLHISFHYLLFLRFRAPENVIDSKNILTIMDFLNKILMRESFEPGEVDGHLGALRTWQVQSLLEHERRRYLRSENRQSTLPPLSQQPSLSLVPTGNAPPPRQITTTALALTTLDPARIMTGNQSIKRSFFFSTVFIILS